MTAVELLEETLEARYVGKRINGPYWDFSPMTVARVRFTSYSDHALLEFHSDETLPRVRCVLMHDSLPEVLS